MRKTIKKARPLSKLALLSISAELQETEVRQHRFQIADLNSRLDKLGATMARELQLVREQFQLTDEWRTQALKAEAEIQRLRDAVNAEISETSLRLRESVEKQPPPIPDCSCVRFDDKPILFLVEIALKKDAKHDTKSYTFDPGIRLEVSGLPPFEDAAMSLTRMDLK